MNIPFDKIYCINVANAKERRNNILNEIKRLGLEDKFQLIISTSYPTSIAKELKTLFSNSPFYIEKYEGENGDKLLYTKLASAVLNHFVLIKSSYELGYNNIIIMEDDINFIDDIDLIEYTLNNIPKDYKILKELQFPYLREEAKKLFNDDLKQSYTKEVLHGKPWGSHFYCLSREGMKLLIDAYNQKFLGSDEIFTDLNSEIYILKNNITYLNDLSETYSYVDNTKNKN